MVIRRYSEATNAFQEATKALKTASDATVRAEHELRRRAAFAVIDAVHVAFGRQPASVELAEPETALERVVRERTEPLAPARCREVIGIWKRYRCRYPDIPQELRRLVRVALQPNLTSASDELHAEFDEILAEVFDSYEFENLLTREGRTAATIVPGNHESPLTLALLFTPAKRPDRRVQHDLV